VVRDATHCASFLDLIELHMLAGLRKYVPAKRLKAAILDAAERLGVDHPLARHSFLRDGGHLFLEKEGAILHLGRAGQLAFPNIIRPRAELIAFADDGIAARWYPLGRENCVVINPSIQGGVPTIDGTRIDTRTLAESVDVEGDVNKVARIYEIDVNQVRMAWAWHRIQKPIARRAA
jgi:uncharacterized protein (DUF433 family)